LEAEVNASGRIAMNYTRTAILLAGLTALFMAVDICQASGGYGDRLYRRFRNEPV
jgi:hypothetical protein